MTLDAKEATLDAALVPGSSVSGMVVRAGGRPAANARVTAGSWTAATSGEDGAFVLRHVADEVKTIEAIAGSAIGSAARGGDPLVVPVEEGRAIAGSVRDADGQPLPGMYVVAFSEGKTHVAVSGEKGDFRIEHLDAALYQVMVYGVRELDFDVLGVPLRDAAATGRADLRAKRQYAITGLVRDEEKRPVAGAVVQLNSEDMPLLYGSMNDEMQPARTAADGTFRLPLPGELPDGAAVTLKVFRKGYPIAISEPVTRNRLHQIITLPGGVELTGVVTDAAGTPVPKAGVVVLQDPSGDAPLPMESALAAGLLRPAVETDAAGKFSLRVSERPHDVGVWKEGYAGARVRIARPGDPLAIVLERGAEIRGLVMHAGGPVAEGSISASGDDASFSTAEVEKDGTFVFAGLRPGGYLLEFRGDPAWTKVRVTAPTSDVVIELPATGTIAGRVIDAVTQKVLRKYHVLADVPGDVPGSMQTATVDRDDSFTMDVVAGPVELDVSADGYVRGEATARVETGKTVRVTIALTPGRDAYGTVTDEQGNPVAGANLFVERGLDITRSRTNGEYRLDTLPREALTITVSAPGLLEREVELPAGSGDTRLDVVLTRGRTASGRVVASDSTAVEGARVTATGTPKQEATTGPDGRFTLSGLGPSPYVLKAKRHELESNAVPLGEGETLLTMKPDGTGTIRGVVEGFSEGQWMVGFVIAEGSHEDRATIGRDGRFRMERVRAGEVELRAHASSARGEATTAPVRVTVVPNGELEAKLVFRTDVRVSGTVYDGGVPAPARKVTFASGSSEWSTVTGENGSYSLAGMEPGVYRVEVESGGREFKTRYVVAGSATFDIRIEWAQVEGHVFDETGAPLAGAEIQLVTAEGVRAGHTKSDANGEFALLVARVPHMITISRPGFATMPQRVEPAAAPLVIRMRRGD